MKITQITVIVALRTLAIIAFITVSGVSFGEALGPLVDDFEDPDNNSLGIQRQFIDDTVAGGGTTIEQSVSAGILSVEGEIVPPRGQPGWASLVLPLDPQGLAKDASAYEGILLRVKLNEGSMSISANSTEVTNFDYHAAPVTVRPDGDFHEVRIPFASMQRAWSEQTPLNPENIGSLSIIAYGLQKENFEFEVDEVSFYQANAND